MDKTIDRYKIENHEQWRDWCSTIPPIKFEPSWRGVVAPPFGGAMARFRVVKGEVSVSVYLDVFDRLGYYGKPYWEVYPYNDDVYRCDMSETDLLTDAISKSIRQQTIQLNKNNHA